jgi:hypothetical protein
MSSMTSSIDRTRSSFSARRMKICASFTSALPEPQATSIFRPPKNIDGGNPFQALLARPQAVVEILPENLGVLHPGHAVVEDRVVRHVEFDDERGIRVLGQVIGHPGEFFADVLGGKVELRPPFKLDDDRRDPPWEVEFTLLTFFTVLMTDSTGRVISFSISSEETPW